MDSAVNIYLLSSLVIVLCILYKYLTKNNGHWKDQKIPEAKGATFGIGHMKDILLLKKNIATFITQIYKDHPNDSMVGIYEFQKPVLILKDLEIIKTVLQTKFNSFSEHPTIDSKIDPLISEDPFFKNGQEWKDSRACFTAAYSAKKLKDLVSPVRDVTQKFLKYLNTKVTSETESLEIETKEIYSKFTAAVSASTVLGIDAQTFVDKDAPDSLRSMMDTMFLPKAVNLKQILVLVVPTVGNFLGMGFVPEFINKGFTSIVEDILSARKKETVPRNDILDLIVSQLKEKNKTEKLAAAYAFGFFVEIYETSSMALSSMSYFLSKNTEVQNKAREEIDTVLKKHGELSYEAVNDLVYLEQVIKETLRLLPPAGRLLKICTEDVTLEGSDGLVCNLKKGDQVIIPLMGIHSDAKHWDNPDKFCPDRFSKSHEAERNRYSFLSFGEGPRMCPGMRFGMLQIKVLMSVILSNYILEPSTKMTEPLKLDPRSFLTTIEGGYWVKIRRRTN